MLRPLFCSWGNGTTKDVRANLPWMGPAPDGGASKDALAPLAPAGRVLCPVDQPWGLSYGQAKRLCTWVHKPRVLLVGLWLTCCMALDSNSVYLPWFCFSIWVHGIKHVLLCWEHACHCEITDVKLSWNLAGYRGSDAWFTSRGLA